MVKERIAARPVLDLGTLIILNNNNNNNNNNHYKKRFLIILIRFLGLCIEAEKPFCIITEYMKGGSLYNLLHSDAKIKWNTAKHIMKGIAAGMLHLQSEGIIHRDLAARNVLVCGRRQREGEDVVSHAYLSFCFNNTGSS